MLFALWCLQRTDCARYVHSAADGPLRKGGGWTAAAPLNSACLDVQQDIWCPSGNCTYKFIQTKRRPRLSWTATQTHQIGEEEWGAEREAPSLVTWGAGLRGQLGPQEAGTAPGAGFFGQKEGEESPPWRERVAGHRALTRSMNSQGPSLYHGVSGANGVCGATAWRSRKTLRRPLVNIKCWTNGNNNATFYLTSSLRTQWDRQAVNEICRED